MHVGTHYIPSRRRESPVLTLESHRVSYCSSEIYSRIEFRHLHLRTPRSAVLAVGLLVLVGSFLYFLSAATGFSDDHFMHVVWGRQIFEGRLFVRDMAPLGMPLQSAVSAAMEQVVGYRLLSEGLIIGIAFAGSALLTFLLARGVSHSLWIGTAAAVVLALAAPRTYSYPKIMVYAAGIALLWRYIDRPVTTRVIALALGVIAAFYLRHDHGLYLGVATVAVVMLRHEHEWRIGLRRCVVIAALSVAAVSPYVLFIERTWGLGAYLDDVRGVAAREYRQNRFESWPRWPLRAIDDIVRWSRETSVEIGVRWTPHASQASRREAAARYGLQAAPDGRLRSGRFVLNDITPANVFALIRDPAIDDTAGIDRSLGTVDLPGLRLGSLHPLAGLDTAPEAAAFLFYALIASVLLALLALILRHRLAGPIGERERLKLATVVIVAVITILGFVREPLSSRIADAMVAPLVLAAWLTAAFLTSRRPAGTPAWKRVARSTVALVLLLLVTRSVVVVGHVSTRLPRGNDWSSMQHQLWTSPPFEAWGAHGTAKYSAVRYIRDCTRDHEPLLVLWFAPDLYYYADRPFGGRLGFYMEGYWVSPFHERANIAAIERDQPLLAIVEEGREATDLYTYPRLLEYINQHYRPIGELPSSGGNAIRVLARTDRLPVSIDSELGWPCYR